MVINFFLMVSQNEDGKKQSSINQHTKNNSKCKWFGNEIKNFSLFFPQELHQKKLTAQFHRKQREHLQLKLSLVLLTYQHHIRIYITLKIQSISESLVCHQKLTANKCISFLTNEKTQVCLCKEDRNQCSSILLTSIKEAA